MYRSTTHSLHLIIFFLFIQSSYSQINCDTQLHDITLRFQTGEKVWKFCGNLDDNGRPTGQGVYYGDTYREEGNFDSGQLSGKGKRVWNNSTQIDSGNFNNGEFISGERISNYEWGKVIRKGDFKENKLHDDNGSIEWIQNDGLRKTEKGKFIKGILLNGQKIEKFSSGLEINYEYQLGEIIGIPIRNDKNYYKESDIVGEFEFTDVKLEKRGDVNSGVAYDIKLLINGVEGVWLFDTGAMNFSIGKRMFERLKSEGISYKDLNQEIRSYGIMNIESKGNLVVIDELKIGEYILKNVIAEVSLDNDSSLLGIEFFEKFSNVEWNLKNETLRLYK